MLPRGSKDLSARKLRGWQSFRANLLRLGCKILEHRYLKALLKPQVKVIVPDFCGGCVLNAHNFRICTNLSPAINKQPFLVLFVFFLLFFFCLT